MIEIKNKFFIRTIICLLIGTFIIFSYSTIYAKYIFQNEFCVANLNIDRTKPKIELVDIKNTNSKYTNYANKTHIITVRIKVTDKNLKEVFLDNEHVKVKISDKIVKNVNIKYNKIQDIENGKIYDIELSSLQGNGILKLDILEGTAKDFGELESNLLEINTKINIDNIAPTGKVIENKISDGKVNANIKLSEQIKNLEGWKFSKDGLDIKKEFTNNISYELPIIDFAGNRGSVTINITKATYINIVYASHNSMVGWSYGYENYDIAGKNAIAENPIYKTEALAFNISGNVDDDFVQGSSYIYTHWGEGSYGKCKTSNVIYNYGYNPLDGSFKSMKSSDLVTMQGKKYFQLGGSGINSDRNTDLNGNNPIPTVVAGQYKYGISGIRFKLKDYSYFSIVYQIFVDNVGWIKTSSNGQECMYAKDKPMSAFRIALVPNTEKQYVIDTWNKDVGTSNIK